MPVQLTKHVDRLFSGFVGVLQSLDGPATARLSIHERVYFFLVCVFKCFRHLLYKHHETFVGAKSLDRRIHQRCYLPLEYFHPANLPSHLHINL